MKEFHDCDTCGNQHRMMEICPAKPGMLELLHGWIDGDREFVNYLAVAGAALIVVAAALLAVTLTT